MKKRNTTVLSKVKPQKTNDVAVRLFGEIRELVDAARQHVAVAVNSTTVMLYWQIGTRIHKDVLGEERAEYGQQIVATLSQQLVAAYGPGFSEKSLRRMIQFAEVFPNQEIVASLMRQLSLLLRRRPGTQSVCRYDRQSDRLLPTSYHPIRKR